MICLFCDTPREKHSPKELEQCLEAGANAGSWGLGTATGWDPDY